MRGGEAGMAPVCVRLRLPLGLSNTLESIEQMAGGVVNP